MRGELREVLTRMAAVSAVLRINIVDPDVDRQEAERLVDDVLVLADPVPAAGHGAGQLHLPELEHEGVDLAFGVVDDRVPIRGLVAGVGEGIE